MPDEAACQYCGWLNGEHSAKCAGPRILILENRIGRWQGWLVEVAESYHAEREVHHVEGELVDAIRAELGYPVIDRTPKFVPRGGE